MYGKLKMRLTVFQHSYISQIWSIQSFAQYLHSAFHKLFRIYFLKKLSAVSFSYKHIKFETDMSIYPECNASGHLFGYRGSRLIRTLITFTGNICCVFAYMYCVIVSDKLSHQNLFEKHFVWFAFKFKNMHWFSV